MYGHRSLCASERVCIGACGHLSVCASEPMGSPAGIRALDGSFCSPAHARQNEPSLSRNRARPRKIQVRENVAFSRLRAPVSFLAPRGSELLMAHFAPLLMPVKMSHHSAGTELARERYSPAGIRALDGSFCSPAHARQNEPSLSRNRARPRKIQVRENVAFPRLRAPVSFLAPRGSELLMAHFAPLLMPVKMSHHSAGTELARERYSPAGIRALDGSFCSPAHARQNEPSLSRNRARPRKIQVRENVAFSRLRAPVTFLAPRGSELLMAHFAPLLMPVKMSHHSAGTELARERYSPAGIRALDGSFCSPAHARQNEPSLSRNRARPRKIQVRENVAFSRLRAPVTFLATLGSELLMAHFAPLLMPVKMSHHSAGTELAREKAIGSTDSKPVVDSDSNQSNQSVGSTNQSDQFPTKHHRLRFPQESQSSQGRLETILIILLAILLFLSVFGSVVLWNVCWRLKKSELISTLQMQFLYHIKQEKDKATAVEAQHRYRMAAKAAQAATGGHQGQQHSFVNGMIVPTVPERYSTGMSRSGVYGEDLEDATCNMNEDDSDSFCGPFGSNGRRPPDLGDGCYGGGGIPTKRKLYFSAEFFEPHLMAEPPPMAEQFLHDLRKMIAITKQRLTIRSRHIPRLSVIFEEESEEEAKTPVTYKTRDGLMPRRFFYYDHKEEELADVELDDLEGQKVSMLAPAKYLGVPPDPVSRPKSPIPTHSICDTDGSPRSAKSSKSVEDSGRESMSNDGASNSDSAHSDSSTTSPPATPPTAAKEVNNTKSIRQLINGFESPSPPQKSSTQPISNLAIPSPVINPRSRPHQTHKPPSSYVPAGVAQPSPSASGKFSPQDSPNLRQNNFNQRSPVMPPGNSSRIPISKSPRLSPKSPLSVAHSLTLSSMDREQGSEMPSVSRHSATIVPPPPPSQPPPPPPIQSYDSGEGGLLAGFKGYNATSKLPLHKKANGGNTYAVFPSDSMKKSLPRRSKKVIAGKPPAKTALPQQPNRTAPQFAFKSTSFMETNM
ncbi:hypothetical protein Ddc_13240 [Ditylenchus destructor]|nr:hypothetical protein Ddc_13240 [Ditylenchus destructor]